jgi:hypothetical protein
MNKRNEQASNDAKNRRQERTLTPGPYEDGVSPEDRLAEHKASMAVPEAGFRVRMNTRWKQGGDERPLVRKMYDIANSTPKRRRRRRKGKKS